RILKRFNSDYRTKPARILADHFPLCSLCSLWLKSLGVPKITCHNEPSAAFGRNRRKRIANHTNRSELNCFPGFLTSCLPPFPLGPVLASWPIRGDRTTHLP